MKNLLQVGLPALLWAGFAHSSPSSIQAAPADYASIMRPTKLSLRDASVEEGLISFSQVSQIPFLIDSTHIPAQSAKTTKDFDDVFSGALGTFAEGHKIEYKRWNESVYLHWGQAETAEVVRWVRSGQGHRPEPTEVSVGALYSLLRKYLRDDPKAKDVLFKPFQITDLPPEMQKPVASLVLAYFLADYWRNPKQTWFDDEIWQKARLRLWIPEPGGQGHRRILLRSVFETPTGTKVLENGLPFNTGGSIPAPMAQDAPQDEAPPPSDGSALALLSSPLPLLNKASGEAMETPITLETKRLPLRQALDSIEKQSGVRLSTQGAPVLDALLLSARAPQMPLFEMMNALSRLYGISWKRVGAGEWSADASKRTELSALALRVGDPSGYRFYDREAGAYHIEMQNVQEMIDRLLESEDKEALVSEPGVAFPSLAPELQKAIRDDVQFQASLGMAMNLGVVQRLVNEGIALRVDPLGRGLFPGHYAPIVFGRSIITGMSDRDEERAQMQEELKQFEAQQEQQP